MSSVQAKNKNYEVGAAFERRVVRYFEDQGFVAIRSAGSHKKFDVIAFNGLTVYAVQCKWNGMEAKAIQLADKLAAETKEQFEEVAYPLVLVVAYDLKDGKLFGPARMLMPKDQRGGVHGNVKENKAKHPNTKAGDA
jgi:hypothetical protein